MRHTFRSLQHRNFRIFFNAQAISFTGTWLQLVAQSLLVYDLTESGTALGLLVATQFAPTLLLGAWAGVVIDRHEKRRLMTITSSVMLAAALTLGVLVLTDNVTLATVYVLAGVLGLANTFDNPARRTLVNDLVPPDDLTNAVSLNSILVTTARIVGPALAGLLVSTVGIGWCFIVNGLTFIAPLVGIWRMDASAFPSTNRVAKEKGQLRAGLRYAWSVDDVRVPLLLMAVIGTLAFNYQVILPVFGEEDLGGTAATYTLLMTMFSIGSLIASVRMAQRASIDARFLGTSAIVLGIASVGLALSPSLPTACVALVVTGYAGIGVLSGGSAVLQLATNAQMRGRVLALYSVVFLGSTPIGGPIIGWVIDNAGTPVAIAIGAVASLAAGVAVLAFVRRKGALTGEEAAPEGALQPA
jgi:MFS family permease